MSTIKLWRFVFCIVALVVGVSFISTPFNNPKLQDFIGLILGGMSLIPLYGYAYNVAIGSKKISIAIFVLNIPGVCYGALLAVLYFLSSPSITQFLLSSIGLSIFLLFIYPLYAYAFKSQQLWTRDT